MNPRDGANGSKNGRMHWGGYGFLTGIVLGVLMGWFFAGFIGAFIRVAMVALAVVPLALLYIAWRRFVAPLLRPPVERRYEDPGYAIETRAVVQGGVREPQPR